MVKGTVGRNSMPDGGRFSPAQAIYRAARKIRTGDGGWGRQRGLLSVRLAACHSPFLLGTEPGTFFLSLGCQVL